MSADFTRIGMTAKLSAYYRQFADIAFAKEAAALVGANEAFEQLARDHALDRDNLTFYAPMFEARYQSITQRIRAAGASQVLELACGYSLRGLDLTQGGALRYVETDLAAVILTKRALIAGLRQRHGLTPSPGHVVAVADALDLEQLRAATSTFDRASPVTVLCEGLVGYLTRDETERLAATVRSVIADHGGGAWLVPDFAFEDELKAQSPERVRLREAVAGITGRQLDASAFRDGEELTGFLRHAGLDAQVYSQIDETPSFTSIQALGLSPDLLDRLRPALRVWVMTPR